MFQRATLALLAVCIAAQATAPARAQPAIPPSTPAAQSAPDLWLPTPPGESWRIIQGYGCGTHDDPMDFYALDLAAEQGDSRGAPVRAAAAGVLMAWVEPSGTLILDHGAGFFTMYTHMEPYLTERGLVVARGSQLGYVGDRGANGNPHLHFAMYTQPPGFDDAARAARRSLPLRFADGYDLPEIGGCSQHSGDILLAAGSAGQSPRIISRRTPGLFEPPVCPLRFGLCMQ